MVIFDKKSKGNGYYNKIFSTSLQIALLSTSAAVIAEGAEVRSPLTPVTPNTPPRVIGTRLPSHPEIGSSDIENTDENTPLQLSPIKIEKKEGSAPLLTGMELQSPYSIEIESPGTPPNLGSTTPDSLGGSSSSIESPGTPPKLSDSEIESPGTPPNLGSTTPHSLSGSSSSIKIESPGDVPDLSPLDSSLLTPEKQVPEYVITATYSDISSITTGSGFTERTQGSIGSMPHLYMNDDQEMLNNLEALHYTIKALDILKDVYATLLEHKRINGGLTQEQEKQKSKIESDARRLHEEKAFLEEELNKYPIKKSFDMNDWNSPNSIPKTPTTNGTPPPATSENQKQDTIPKPSIQKYIEGLKLPQITHKKGTTPLDDPFTPTAESTCSTTTDKPSPPRMNPRVNKRLFTDESSSATKIQASFRKHLAEKDYVEKKKAATKIQSIVRMHQAKANYQKQREAATLIENTFRGYKAKKELGILKTNAAIEERKKKEIAFNIAKEAATKASQKALTKTAQKTISKAVLNWKKLRKYTHNVGSAAVTVKQWQSYASNKKNATITKGVMHFLHSSDIAIDKRMSTAIAAGDEKSMEKRFWIKGVVGKAEQTGDNAFSSINNAVVIGCDAEVIEDSLTLGVAYSTGANKSKIKEDSTKIKTHIDMFSLYGRYNLTNNFFFKGTASYGTLKIYGTGDDTNKGSTYRASGKVGYNFAHKNNVIITPEIGLSYNKVAINSYKETIPGAPGRPANTLVHPKYSTDVFACDIGASASATKQIASGTITPNIHTGIKIVIKENFKNNKAYYVRTQNPSDIPNEQNTKTTYNLGCGVDISRNGAVNLSVGYDANFRKNYKAHNGFIKLELKF